MISLRNHTPLLAGIILSSAPVVGYSGQEAERNSLFYGHIHTASTEPLQIHACPFTPVEVSASAHGIKLSSRATESLVDLGEIESTEIVAGDFWRNGQCFIAIKSSVGIVNDSFEIYRMDSKIDKKKWSAINPEFAHGQVVSSYRDAARWHEETLCYSKEIDSPFLCSKRASATDQVQRLIVCDDQGECSDPVIVFAGTDNDVTATVTADRAFFFENSGDSFERRRAYLVKDDSVTLLDFSDRGAERFFKARYTGKSGTTVGWLSSDDLSILDPD